MIQLTDYLGYPLQLNPDHIVGINICQQYETEHELDDSPHARITTVGGHVYIVRECMIGIFQLIGAAKDE